MKSIYHPSRGRSEMARDATIKGNNLLPLVANSFLRVSPIFQKNLSTRELNSYLQKLFPFEIGGKINRCVHFS